MKELIMSTEAHYMAENEIGYYADYEFAKAEREKEILELAKRKREQQDKINNLRSSRKQMITDLITLGVLTGSVDEHMEKLEKKDRSFNQTKNTSSAKVGEKMTCLNCNREFVKKSYNQVFCSNQKKKFKGRDCKSEFHNRLNY